MKEGLKPGDSFSHTNIDPETGHRILWKYVVRSVDPNDQHIITASFVGSFDLDRIDPIIGKVITEELQ